MVHRIAGIHRPSVDTICMRFVVMTRDILVLLIVPCVAATRSGKKQKDKLPVGTANFLSICLVVLL